MVLFVIPSAAPQAAQSRGRLNLTTWWRSLDYPRDDRNCAHRVWGDSAFRGQTAVIRDKAPCAVGFTQPHSSRAKNLSKQQLWFAEVAIVDLRKTRIVGRKLRTFESLLESETLAEGVVRPKVAQTTR